MYVRQIFKKPKTIIPEFLVSPTASVADSTTIVPNGSPCTLHCSTGTVWFNTLTTATTSNGYRLPEGTVVDLVANTVSVISDSTTAKLQAIIWAL